jgi:hypothetical protein
MRFVKGRIAVEKGVDFTKNGTLTGSFYPGENHA